MKGIYLHIPFCRQACRYCDFFFSVSLHHEDKFVESLIREINKRGREHSGGCIKSLYFGGGTPSVLSPENLDRILEAIHQNFSLREDAEVSIECNPDDLDPSFVKSLTQQGFNRLSIGIQSFQEKDLKLMRRSHQADQAERSVKIAADAGFDNLSIDLIYGIPGQTIAEWEGNVQRAIGLPISHLSAYHLTFESGTVFDHWRKKGRLLPVHEEESILAFQLLREKLLSAGYDHYEISNFGLRGNMSRHNLLYWSGLPYLGMGPSAHSFDGTSRSWNISSLKGYIESTLPGKGVCEKEILSKKEKYHDYLITSLRTKWGADPGYIEDNFGGEFRKQFEAKSAEFLMNGSMWITQGKTAIHPGHWLISDHILRELFVA